MSYHFRHTGSETKEIDHDLATGFSTMLASVTERELDNARMAYLKNVVLGGTALPFIWARAKVLETGEVYRVNGHHSSHMLASLNGELPAGLIAHIDDYEVPTVKELPLLFQQFDSRKSTRSMADISGAYQMTNPQLRNASRTGARKAIYGVAWYDRTIVGKSVPMNEGVFTLFNNPAYHDFIYMVDRIYSAKTPEFSNPVLGAMYGTWLMAPAEATSFWTDVAHQGGNNDDKHPAAVLDAWLLAIKAATGEKKPKQQEVYRACVVAWNAFRNGRTLEKIGKWDAKKGLPDLE